MTRHNQIVDDLSDEFNVPHTNDDQHSADSASQSCPPRQTPDVDFINQLLVEPEGAQRSSPSVAAQGEPPLPRRLANHTNASAKYGGVHPSSSSARKPLWPTVLGVLGIICAMNEFASAIDSMLRAFQQPTAGRIVVSLVTTVLAAWLLRSSVGLLRRQAKAFASLRLWASTFGILTVIYSGGAVAMVLTVWALFPPEFRDLLLIGWPQRAGLLLATLIAARLTFPLIVLLFARRPAVLEEVDRWTDHPKK